MAREKNGIRDLGFRQKDGGRSVGILDLHLLQFIIAGHFLSLHNY